MATHRVARLAAVAAALIALTAGALAGLVAAAPAAFADTAPSLQLGQGSYGAWTMTGHGFSPGRTDVQVWVMDTTNGSWTTLEHQSGLTTSIFRVNQCGQFICPIHLGGMLSATGQVGPGVPGGFGPFATHPLACGRSYRPVAYDAVDGYVYGPTYSQACPVLH
jgi:hypothetical protein